MNGAIKDDLKANVYIDHKGDKIGRVTSYLCSIFKISSLSDPALWMLRQFTCLPPEFHEFDLLQELLSPAEHDKEDIFSETIEELSGKGWLLKNSARDSYKMHRIIGEVIKLRQTISFTEMEPFINNISEKLYLDETSENPVDNFPWIPFGKSVLDLFPNSTEPPIVKLQNNLAIVLQNLGDYEGAKNLLQKAMASDEKNFGNDHPTTAVRYSNLALVLQDLGDYEGAKNLLQKAMASDEKNFGNDHPSTARSYSNLALVLEDLGDYEEALKLSEKSLTILRKVLPEGHPNIKTVTNNYQSIKEKLTK
ncbi:MAG: tetratricopeptide repeat protein [Desulfobulbaceae bacterium]|nr:tetratricopeptide repeat protein [Desulfobulbaceae bacterium]